MKGLLKFALIAAFLMVGVSSNSQDPKELFVPGTIIRAELRKSVDVKKAKVGDNITARFIEDFLPYANNAPAPKGLKVTGHVVEVALRHGESASRLGITFDKIILRNGTEVPLKMTIQAIGRPELDVAAGNNGASPMSAQAPMSLKGAMGTGTNAPVPTGSMPAGDNTGAGATPGTAANGRLTPEAQGVVGMSGVSLAPGGAEDSVISSQKHNLQLISGTQMILCVIP
jgi:hypothetical protein